ncbi:MAG TPA: ABC transporter permease, partial [Longimicrobiales bacterium]|nr:ABC transporter permease [Longimicrobiales bacterium]
MSTWVQDVRYGLRMLASAPVVSTVAALSLALGIAANASTFSVLDAFLLDPLPYRDQDGLVILREGRQGLPVEAFSGVAMGNFRDYERASPSIAAAGAYTLTDVNLTGGDVPEQLRLVEATPNLFDVLGVAPSLGRGFRPEEGAEGVGTVVVLEHDFWRRHFAEDRDVLGRTLTLDGATHTVIGVMPESFDLIPADVDVFRPTGFAAQRENRDVHGYLVLGRLVPGATAAQVQSELDGVSARIAAEHPEGNRGWVLAVIPLRGFFPGATDKKLVLVLTAVTLFGLLIACANVANLLLGRAEERQKEVAVRTALGAGRARILRQLLTESVSLGLLAGVLGTAVAVFVVRWIRAAMPPMIPKAMVPSLDPEVVAASLGVSILAGIAFGIAPSLHATRGDLREALAEGSRGGTASRSRRRLRSVFVVGEFAVALALLTGAAFLMEVFRQVIDADPGFRQE